MHLTDSTNSSRFKASVVFSLLQGKRTSEELQKEYNLSSEMILQWKEQFIQRASLVYQYVMYRSEDEKDLKDEYMYRIRELRQKNGYSQKEIGDFLGTAQNMYARYENGKSQMPLRYLVQLAYLYQISADEILGIGEKVKNYAGDTGV